MYQKPKVLRFGTLRELTLLGCGGPSDGVGFEGATSVGNDGPILEDGTTLWCFIQRS
jgi:hypothetical protein